MPTPRPHPRGFTLIELLVATAILAILAGLVLSGVQKVRASAARTHCQNNLRQLALAALGHLDARGFLPAGAASDAPPDYGTGLGWGSSWAVFVLPYLEQDPLSRQLRFDGNSGYDHPVNAGVFGPARVTPLLCPSSPAGETVGAVTPGRAVGGWDLGVSHYVGIAGAAPFGWDGTPLLPGYTDGRYVFDGAGPATQQRFLAANGALSPGTSPVGPAQLRDGAANVLLFGEQNSTLILSDGTTAAWGAGLGFGWPVGWYAGNLPVFAPGGLVGGSPAAATAGAEPVGGRGTPGATLSAGLSQPSVMAFNTTTVRYPLNLRSGPDGRGWPAGGCDISGAAGVCADSGPNVPLLSAHPGGVNVAFADGSVRFLADGLPVAELARLAVRDDGQTVGGDY